jgi:hypothetical protein
VRVDARLPLAQLQPQVSAWLNKEAIRMNQSKTSGARALA